jgi:hypothetical protein
MGSGICLKEEYDYQHDRYIINLNQGSTVLCPMREPMRSQEWVGLIAETKHGMISSDFFQKYSLNSILRITSGSGLSAIQDRLFTITMKTVKIIPDLMQ